MKGAVYVSEIRIFPDSTSSRRRLVGAIPPAPFRRSRLPGILTSPPHLDPKTVIMKRLFQTLAIVVAVWVLGSFVGVMFDSARANLWTQSLMWAMLTSVILAPVFIFIGTSPSSTSDVSSQEAEKPFEVDDGNGIDMNRPQEETAEEEGWPYTS